MRYTVVLFLLEAGRASGRTSERRSMSESETDMRREITVQMGTPAFPVRIEHAGQVYDRVAVRWYQTRVRGPGRWVELVDWSTHCAACGKQFITSTPKKFAATRRRCDACKAPGRLPQPLLKTPC